jgi:hypothetical protein
MPEEAKHSLGLHPTPLWIGGGLLVLHSIFAMTAHSEWWRVYAVGSIVLLSIAGAAHWARRGI